jgi:hypothetical protein
MNGNVLRAAPMVENVPGGGEGFPQSTFTVLATAVAGSKNRNEASSNGILRMEDSPLDVLRYRRSVLD